MNIFANLLKSLYATFLSSLFGILQILVIYFLSQMSLNRRFNLLPFYDEGFFLFFSVALISSVLVEYFIDAKIQTNVYLNSFILIGCVMICLFCMLAYSKIFLQLESTNRDYLTAYQNNFLIISLLISIFLKFSIYSKKQ
jgi:hypothetical protein